MKTTLFILLMLPLLALCQQSSLPKKKTTTTNKEPAIQTTVDSFSYAIAFNVALNLKQQGIDQLNQALVRKAFSDVYEGKPSAIDTFAANQVVQQKFAALSAARGNKEKLKGLDFLNANKKRTGVITTSSGLQYEIITKGNGKIPVDTSTVLLYYTAITIDGKRFDSTAKGLPVTLRIKDAIAGWAEVLKLMPVGSKWNAYIPFYLAYGDEGHGPNIPPGTTLVFEMELLSVAETGRQ